MEHLTLGTRNILAVYYRATPLEVGDGLSWYARAQAAAQTLADTYGLTLPVVAGVISALSPLSYWERNVAAAERVIQAFQTGIPVRHIFPAPNLFWSNTRKAIRILRDQDPEEAFNTATADKTRNFFRLIRDGGNESDVTIDGHAASIWFGQRFGVESARENVGNLSGKNYERIADDYRAAAAVLGIAPHQTQAVTWLAWRRIHGVYVSATAEQLGLSL